MRKLSPRKMSHPIIVEETGRKLKEVGVVDKVANKLSLLESKINNCLARNHKQKLPNPYNRLGVEET